MKRTAAASLCLVLWAVALVEAAAAAAPSAEFIAAGYTPRSGLAIDITCEKSDPHDPMVSLVATNERRAKIPIPLVPVLVIVDLTLTDASGKTVSKGALTSVRYGIMPDYVLLPGESLQLSDWIVRSDKPRTTHFPLSYFGYHDLAAGAYTVTASATAPAIDDLSSQCMVRVQ